MKTNPKNCSEHIDFFPSESTEIAKKISSIKLLRFDNPESDETEITEHICSILLGVNTAELCVENTESAESAEVFAILR